MNTYKRHRFRLGAPTSGRPPDLISYAVWLYYRFNLSHGDEPWKIVADKLRSYGVAHREHYRDLREGAFNEWETVVCEWLVVNFPGSGKLICQNLFDNTTCPDIHHLHKSD
jgi:hypothetical protein